MEDQTLIVDAEEVPDFTIETEEDKDKTFTFRLTLQEYNYVKRMARDDSTSIGSIIRRAIKREWKARRTFRSVASFPGQDDAF